MSDDIAKEIDNLNKALEAGFDCKVNEPVFRVNEIYKDIESLLTDKAKEMLSKPKVKQLTSLKDDGEVDYVVRYFGVTTSFRSTGALKLAKIINEIADKYQVVGVLSLPCQVELITESLTRPSDTASFFYVAIPPNDAVLAERYEFILSEGGMPNRYLENLDDMEEARNKGLDKLDPIIEGEKPGTIHYRFRVAHIMATHNGTTPEYRVQKEADKILNFLPNNTEYLGATLRPIQGLYYEYHMKFRNDIFVTDAELKDLSSWNREIAVYETKDGEDKLVQFDANHELYNFNDFIQTKYKDKKVTLGEAKKFYEKGIK